MKLNDTNVKVINSFNINTDVVFSMKMMCVDNIKHVIITRDANGNIKIYDITSTTTTLNVYITYVHI
jgi:hypothetical protein